MGSTNDSQLEMIHGAEAAISLERKNNTYIVSQNNLLFFLKDVSICNFSDDTTTYISEKRLENVLQSLEKNSMIAMKHLIWERNDA